MVKPPPVPIPGIGGGGMTMMNAPWIAESRLRRSLVMTAAVRPFLSLTSGSSNTGNSAAALLAWSARISLALMMGAALGGYLPENFYRSDIWLLAADGRYDRVAVRGRARPFSAQQHLLDRLAEHVDSNS